jgi:serine/threonine-protein kinase
LAGHPPFQASNRMELLLKIVKEEANALPPDLPPELIELVQRSLAKKPDDRFASAAEMRARLLECDLGERSIARRCAIAFASLAAVLLAVSPLWGEEPQPIVVPVEASVEPVMETILRDIEPVPKTETKPRRVRAKKPAKKKTTIDLIREYR